MGTKAFVKGLEGSWYRKECTAYVLAMRTHLSSVQSSLGVVVPELV